MQDLCFSRKILERDFLHEKHVNYLLKSLKKSTSDASPETAEAYRLSSLFFVVSGLDLLGTLHTRLSQSERADVIDHIYKYQVDTEKIKFRDPVDSSGDISLRDEITAMIDIQERRAGHSGFRATSMIDSDIPLDCGIISMTYCALATLMILGDDLRRVDRELIIAGIRHLQMPDGSFKPSVLGGESDMRLVYCAVAVSRLLDDWSGIDIDRCAKFIKDSLTYEGAFAQCPGAEAHGGSTYCALASLKLMSKLEDTLNEQEVDQLSRWCVNRLIVGFNGRPNKEHDTCYSFWIGACLVMLDHFKYIDQTNLLNFMLGNQEERGGLSKSPSVYSDPLHTYLGFAGLTFMDDALCSSRGINLLKLDPTLNISMRAKGFLDKLHRSWRQTNSKQAGEDIHDELVSDLAIRQEQIDKEDKSRALNGFNNQDRRTASIHQVE